MKQHVGHDSNIRFVQVSREKNADADHLAKVSPVKGMILHGRVLSSVQYTPAMDQIKVQAISPGDDWMVPIISYLKEDDFSMIMLV